MEKKDIIHKIDLLVDKIEKIESRIGRLEKIIDMHFPFSIEGILREKGYEIIREGNPDLFKGNEGVKFFQNLKSYFFRRTTIDILRLREIDEEQYKALMEKWGGSAVEYVKILKRTGIIKEFQKKLKANYSFEYSGVILEWFIAKAIKELLGMESKFAVKLKNLRLGGDIDVIARSGSKLIMIECKESPPNNVPVSELKAITKRVEALKPDYFIFVLDTTLSLKRNIIDNLSWITKSNPLYVKIGVYKFGENLFVINAKRDLIKNLIYVVNRIS